jgi:hypothetical protein
MPTNSNKITATNQLEVVNMLITMVFPPRKFKFHAREGNKGVRTGAKARLLSVQRRGEEHNKNDDKMDEHECTITTS